MRMFIKVFLLITLSVYTLSAAKKRDLQWDVINDDVCTQGKPLGVICQIGPKGPRGVTGPTGAVGNTGNEGDVGCPGDIGDTGLIGCTGLIGPTGLTGDIGPEGPKGETGPGGDPAPSADIGPTGPKGPTGATGNIGLDGNKGPTGMGSPHSITKYQINDIPTFMWANNYNNFSKDIKSTLTISNVPAGTIVCTANGGYQMYQCTGGIFEANFAYTKGTSSSPFYFFTGKVENSNPTPGSSLFESYCDVIVPFKMTQATVLPAGSTYTIHIIGRGKQAMVFYDLGYQCMLWS